MRDKTTNEQLLTVADLARLLRRSENAIRHDLSRDCGRLPKFVRLGRLIRFRPEAVASWLDSLEKPKVQAITGKRGRPLKYDQVRN